LKKAYSYDDLGEKRCIKCNKLLKKRIQVEHPRFTKCYRCFRGLPPKESKEAPDSE